MSFVKLHVVSDKNNRKLGDQQPAFDEFLSQEAPKHIRALYTPEMKKHAERFDRLSNFKVGRDSDGELTINGIRLEAIESENDYSTSSVSDTADAGLVSVLVPKAPLIKAKEALELSGLAKRHGAFSVEGLKVEAVQEFLNENAKSILTAGLVEMAKESCLQSDSELTGPNIRDEMEVHLNAMGFEGEKEKHAMIFTAYDELKCKQAAQELFRMAAIEALGVVKKVGDSEVGAKQWNTQKRELKGTLIGIIQHHDLQSQQAKMAVNRFIDNAQEASRTWAKENNVEVPEQQIRQGRG